MENKYKWKDFTLTDNSCKQEKDSPLVLREKFAQKLILTEEEQLVAQLTQLRSAAVNTIVQDEKGRTSFLFTSLPLVVYFLISYCPEFFICRCREEHKNVRKGF